MRITNFYVLTFLFFLVDFASHYILEYQLLNTLFCFLIFLVLTDQSNKKIILPIFLLSSIDLITYGSGIPSLCYFTGISMLLYYAQHHLNTSLKTVFYGALTLCLLAKALLLDHLYYGIGTINLYTGYEIFVTIIVMFLLLKYTPKGKQGNRL